VQSVAQVEIGGNRLHLINGPRTTPTTRIRNG
jgi:hypothetical protein